MKNITLITSIIDTPNLPLSYTNVRSVFNKQQRFEQTKRTISTIREKIPDNKIFLIECSPLTDQEREYFMNTCDYFFNVYDTSKTQLIKRMHTQSKSMGEGTMTILSLKYLFEHNVEFDYLFKISGRYWLNEGFDYCLYDNEYSMARTIFDDPNNVVCCFYKLTRDMTQKWLDFLISSEKDFQNCIGYEVIFAKFLNCNTYKKIDNKIGIHGYISVCGGLLDA
jgi:hypothetical protein